MEQPEEKNQSPGKTLAHLPGGEKQNEWFKDVGRWRAEVQANNYLYNIITGKSADGQKIQDHIQ